MRPLSRLTDDEIADTRLCDLPLALERSPLATAIACLHRELAAKNLDFRPHAWLSTGWFSPHGVPGVALPFYLAHPRLKRLEERETFEVEGGTPRALMQLLRHEAGHALDTAYGVHQSAAWRARFGRFGERYHAKYRPRPFRREFVLHLDGWYAQSHPAEDFAETFAVWLDPSSRWRARYGDWPAIEKLEWVEREMAKLAGRRPRVRSREQSYALSTLRITLRQYHAWRRHRQGRGRPRSFDRELRLLFAPIDDPRRRLSPARCLARLRREIHRRMPDGDVEERYTVEQVVRALVQRAFELELAVDARDPQARLDSILDLGHLVMRSLRGGKHRLNR